MPSAAASSQIVTPRSVSATQLRGVCGDEQGRDHRVGLDAGGDGEGGEHDEQPAGQAAGDPERGDSDRRCRHGGEPERELCPCRLDERVHAVICRAGCHRRAIRGAAARRPRSRRTWSTVPGPRHATMGMPACSSSRSVRTRSRSRMRQASALLGSGAWSGVGSGSVSMTSTIIPSRASPTDSSSTGADSSGERTRARPPAWKPSRASSAGRLICRGGYAAGFDRGELSEDPAKVGGSVSDLDECSAGRADGSKGNAVAVAEEVGGDGAGTPHRPIEAAGRSVDPTAGTGVDGCVDDEQDVGVAVGVGGGDVEGAGSQRHGPVDSSEAIPDRERSDRGELGAVAATPRSVQPDQAGRAGHGRGAVEDGRQRQGRELRQCGARRPEPECAEGRARRDQCRPDLSAAPLQ